jgi:hypothetical protein
LLHARLAGLGFDATKDPVCFSRLPNCPYGDTRQRPLATNIGARNWEEWEASLEINDGTEWFDLDNLSSFDRKNDPNCMIGDHWLCRGDSFILQGYTGIGKSSLVLQMAMSWALGKSLFGIKPKRPLRLYSFRRRTTRAMLRNRFKTSSNML